VPRRPFAEFPSSRIDRTPAGSTRLGIPVEPAPMTATTLTDEEGKPRGITEEDLATMAPEEIVMARKAGRLRHFGVAP
jgi:hypothetical protein